MFEWTDPDDGTVYEINYIVTHTEAEGPEYLEWRIKPDPEVNYDLTSRMWFKLPPFALDPEVAKEVEEHFHGKLIEGDYNKDIDNPEDIPTINVMFSNLRADADDIDADDYDLDRISRDLRMAGAMDEPLIDLIKGALDGNLTTSEKRLLRHLVSEG